MSLYTKYRPQNFTNLVGQDHIRQTLLNEIQNNQVSHAYLFAGPRGTGKTSSARLIAKAINCTNKNSEGEPCDSCEFCKSIVEGSLIDVIEIDAASNRGIDEIRDLKEKINFAPTRAKAKTYIIDEVHMLTKEAFNALLKTLEEPPENVFFILCTTEIHKIPETIISRCQRFDFKRIDVKTIMTRLNYIAQMEGIASEDGAIDLIAKHAEGGMRDAIGLLEQMSIDGKLGTNHVRSHLGITGHSTITTLIDLLEKKELTKALHVINEVHNEGYDLTSFTREILECLRDRLITSVQIGEQTAFTKEVLEMIERFEDARDGLRNTVIPQLPLEIAAIKICGDRAEIRAEVMPVELIQAPEVTAKANEEEKETIKTVKQEYEHEHLKDGDITKHWARVLEHVSPPSLMRSLSDARVAGESDSTVKLTFGSQFHMDKVKMEENRAKVEKAITHLFQKNLKVECVFDDTLAPKKEIAPQSRESKPKKKEDVTEKAMEIFGNEW